MPTITPKHLQELITRLPAAKLPLAHCLLLELAEKEMNLLLPQPDFVALSFKRCGSKSRQPKI